MQTLLSGRTDLQFGRFAALMLGIHLPIALVEGVVTAGVVQYVRELRPTLVNGAGLVDAATPASGRRETLVPVLASLAAMAILAACVGAWFASPRPDGLESSIEHARKGAAAPTSPVPLLEQVQTKTAVMPDYDFPPGTGRGDASAPPQAAEDAWPNVQAGTSVAGLVGSGLTFALVCLFGLALYWLQSRRRTIGAG